jgi:hypothetical protein
MSRRVRSILAVIIGVLALASCRVDVDVIVALGPDGSGEVVVTATADAELVQQAPGLAEDLRFDDAIAAGWVVEGPGITEDGGLTVTLRRPVTSAADANSVLASLGPPFVDVRLERTVDDDDPERVTVNLTGQLQLSDGFASFADSDLTSAIGGAPVAAEIAAAGATPTESLDVVLRAELPGAIESTTGEQEGNTVTWSAPLDGTALDLATTTEQRPDRGPAWSGPVSWLALLLLVAWLALVGVAGWAIMRGRRRRAARRDRALSRLR